MEQSDIEDIYPLSHIQQGLLFHSIYAPNSEVYFEQSSFTLRGYLNTSAFERAWQLVTDRHTILRTSFFWEGVDEPLQVVHRKAKLPIDHQDWRSFSADEQEKRLEVYLQEDRAYGFNFSQAPLMRLALIRLADDLYQFIWSQHHLLLDGWSLPLLLKEVFAYYDAFCRDQDLQLPCPRPYRDYIAWLSRQKLSEAESFWRRALKGFASPTPLVIDKDQGEVHEGSGYAQQKLSLSLSTTEALRSFARTHQLTLNTIVQGAWGMLLSRYSGAKDVVFGATTAGRPTDMPDSESMIGIFINTLPVRIQARDEDSVLPWLCELQRQQVEMRQYEHCPLVNIQGWSDVPRGRPLFESILIFENYPEGPLDRDPAQTADIQITLEILNSHFIERTNYPITVLVEPDSRLTLTISYHRNRFETAAIGRMLGHFQTLLEGMIRRSYQRLAHLPLLREREERELLFEWNETAREYPRRQRIHQLFEARVEQTPDAIAIAFESMELTFKHLNDRANQLAHYLQKLGVGPESLVGVCVERSIEMVVGLLGILKSGGAYIPLDPKYPRERLLLMLEDAGVQALLTQQWLAGQLSDLTPRMVLMDEDRFKIEQESIMNPVSQVTSDNIAYVIYTSGSTGRPKGVMIDHREVINFFTGMDDCIGSESPGVWLAVTSISFDISVLETLWTLTRGFKVVIQAENRMIASAAKPNSNPANREMDFSLFYFADDKARDGNDKYKLLIEGAKFADRHGFSAVWTPERHFHNFGGLYPNPAVIGGAIAAITERIQIRAGSVVLPLHNPIRVAEEWSVIDNLAKGRVGLSFASGWHVNDFIFAPENYDNRHEVMYRDIEIIRQLWRGKAIRVKGVAGRESDIEIFPKPVQQELPIWITAAGSADTFRAAGAMGANILTHLLGQNINHLAEKIAIYREAWRKHGHGPGAGYVTLMLHTFIADTVEVVRGEVIKPLSKYFKSSVSLVQNLAQSVGFAAESEAITDVDLEALISHGFDRYIMANSLIGTPDLCSKMIDRLKMIGVNEVACLIDFGMDFDSVLASLHRLDALRESSNRKSDGKDHGSSLIELMSTHRVSHLQCTPPAAEILTSSPEAAAAIGLLEKLLIGGDAFSPALAERLLDITKGELRNMYGPTETTIWSTTCLVDKVKNSVPIGRPIANTQIYILDQMLRPTPAGVPGELFIGGVGVARGYLRRPEFTAEKFTPDPFGKRAGNRLYRTGDLARYAQGGNIEFLGRLDHQLKIRGYRIEPGEIEVALRGHQGLRDALVTAQEDDLGGKRLVAHLIAQQGKATTAEELRRYLRDKLPDYMLPSHYLFLESFPLTPNGKIDRQALPIAAQKEVALGENCATPRTAIEDILAGICAQVLGVDRVGVYDNFFDLGGHSLMVMLVIARVRDSFQIELPLLSFFESPTVAELAKKVEAALKFGDETKTPPIVSRVSRSGELPLSFAQERLWFLSNLDPGNISYHEHVAIAAPGLVDLTIMRRTINDIVRRHETLRTTFTSIDGRPIQIIAPPQPAPLPLIDLSELPPVEAEAEAKRLAVFEVQQPFDLAQGPLMRAKLLRLREKEHVLFFTLHHIICDGWSLGVLTNEVPIIYDAFSQARPSPLPEPVVQYADYAQWQREWLQGEALNAQLSYWREKLSGHPPVLELPTDRPRPAAQTYDGARQEYVLPASLTEAIKVLSRREGVTVFMTVLAAFKTLLYRYTGESDIVIGLPIAGRNRVETEGLIGCFVNMLVLRTDLSGNLSFRELLARVRKVAIEAYAHQDLPFEKLVDALRPDRKLSHTPLFQIVFLFQNAAAGTAPSQDQAWQALTIDSGTAAYDIVFYVAEENGEMGGYLRYNTTLFDAATVVQMVKHFENLLEDVTKNPELLLLEARLTDREREGHAEAAFLLNQTYADDRFAFSIGQYPDSHEFLDR